MSAVRVYQIALHPETTPEVYEAALTPDERARRDRFYFAPDRQAYTVYRGALRLILARALDRAPDRVALRLGPYGKPHLVDDALHFNVSHSGDIALIALSAERPLGVDIEQERPLEDLFALAKRHFSPTERGTLRGLPDALQTPAFFRCWSRKEAFIKAIGLGLHFPLEGFDVTLDPRAPARIVAIRDDRYRDTPWVLHHLDIAHGYSAALVTPGPASVGLVSLTSSPPAGFTIET